MTLPALQLYWHYELHSGLQPLKFVGCKICRKWYYTALLTCHQEVEVSYMGLLHGHPIIVSKINQQCDVLLLRFTYVHALIDIDKGGQSHSWSTHDIACLYCRERKVRCGRERPQCANCKRDRVECEYSSPGKRVNHIKLLCNNVGVLEDRLSNIEGGLSLLTTLLKASGSPKPCLNIETDEESPITFSTTEKCDEEEASVPATNRYIVRSQVDRIDRYHGPSTLFALCKEFSDISRPERPSDNPSLVGDESQPEEQNRSFKDEAVKDVIAFMCAEAGNEEFFDIQSDFIPVRLPPKQFLLMVQSQFFKQPDYATDIFVQSCFWSNVERIYSRPYMPGDEAWIYIYNIIILLVLGSETSTDSNPLVGPQFTQPFLLAVRTALSNTRVLMAPKLVNVQALALLSIVAQHYYPPGFTETIFAQACVLARTMGLHQMCAASEGVDEEEAEGRLKVFRSLYLRDKSYSISRGSICWLPSYDCSLSSQLGQTAHVDSTSIARVQLASIQEEIYRSFHSAESQRQPSAKHKSALLRIEQGLERWVTAHDMFSSPWADVRDVDLQLEFLAARISAFRMSSELSHIRRTLDDARASCMLLLISFDKHDQSMIERLEALPLTKSPSKALIKAGGHRPSKSKSSRKDNSSTNAKENQFETLPSRFHSLLDTFSVPGFFLLVRNVVSPELISDDSQADDIRLLQKVCACYKELEARAQVNNHTRKVGRAFEKLLEVINLTTNPAPYQSSPFDTQHSSNAPTPSSIQNFFGNSQVLSDFIDLSSQSAYQVPHMSWDSFSNKTLSPHTTDTSNPGSLTGLLTPIESEFISQPYYSQQNMSSPVRKRQRAGDSDISMDEFSDSRLLSNFLAANPLMSFDASP